MPLPYFQSSEFTCGPACLMMAMQKLDPKRQFDPLEEFLIWREANSIFMGHRHAGCTQYGLARAALRRGFGAEIYTEGLNNFDRHFEDCVLDAKEKAVFKTVHAYDKKRAQEEGLKVHKEPFSKGLLTRLLDSKKALIMLVRSFEAGDEHWIVIRKAGEEKISIIDPYEKHLTNKHAVESQKGTTHRLDTETLKKFAFFGKGKDYLLLVIGKNPTATK